MPTIAAAGVTGVLEALASSIGSGLVVGGFAAGATGFVASHPRARVEKRSLSGGYAGGLFALLALAIDTMWKHFV